MMRTANPALNANTFQGLRSYDSANAMTIQGTVNKTAIMLFLIVLSASWVWGRISQASGWLMIGAFGGLIVGIVTVFKKEWAPITAPLYALLEGLVIGGISSLFEAQFPGIVIQAVMLTFGTLGALLLAYKSGLIKPTENLKLGIVAATGAIALVYLVSFILGFFGRSIPLIHGSGPVGIGFSIIVIIIAALNLVLDFDFIERGAQQGAPKFMEWYGAFGLIVTLIWLYLEMLRLLAKLQSRRRQRTRMITKYTRIARMMRAGLFLCLLLAVVSCSQQESVSASAAVRFNSVAAGDFTPGQLEAHYAKHRAEFGAITVEEYLDGARSLLNAAPSNDVLEKARANGDILRYRVSTREFAVMASDGRIRTYFKADYQYWLRQ